ncbi:transposase [Nesterenkonia salmonea]|uniref:transposase n=1 Tax=Nesterenkonia salmonea TaxID=1804987 RepID=UPI001AA090E0|nr:transposase [Nesterenkonia salmonea]
MTTAPIETPETTTAIAGGAPGAPRGSRAKRRSFTAEYKRRIVAEYDAAAVGTKGEVLRREGLFDSHIKDWRRHLEAGTLASMGKRRSGKHKSPEQQRIAELERALAKAEAESARKDKVLAKREEALEVLGKGVEFLEALSKKDQK